MVTGTVLEKVITQALDELYTRDYYLLEHKLHERSIVFRYAHYLQNIIDCYEEFKDYNLDLEYNRNGNNPKHIPIRDNGAIPDLIIHKRGSNKDNLLIIEFKTYWDTEVDDDYKKLSCFVNPRGKYRYTVGLSIIFGRERESVRIESV